MGARSEPALSLCRMPRLPAAVSEHKRTEVFDPATTPAGLRKSHATKAGVWGEIVVLEGRVLYAVENEGDASFVLRPGVPGAIAPGVPHHVEPQDGARFSSVSCAERAIGSTSRRNYLSSAVAEPRLRGVRERERRRSRRLHGALRRALSYLAPTRRRAPTATSCSRSDSWQKASHTPWPTCVDATCLAFLPKYVAKAENGWHHSVAFTTQDFDEPIRIKGANIERRYDNCIRCHGAPAHPLVASGRRSDGTRRDEALVFCVHCHADVGHGQQAGLGGRRRPTE